MEGRSGDIPGRARAPAGRRLHPGAVRAAARCGRGREVPVSVFAHRGEDWTPDGLAAELREWKVLGASRYLLTLSWDDDLPAMVTRIAEARHEASDSGTQ